MPVVVGLEISMWIDKSCFSYVQTDGIEMLVALLKLVVFTLNLLVVMVYSW